MLIYISWHGDKQKKKKKQHKKPVVAVGINHKLIVITNWFWNALAQERMFFTGNRVCLFLSVLSSKKKALDYM